MLLHTDPRLAALRAAGRHAEADNYLQLVASISKLREPDRSRLLMEVSTILDCRVFRLRRRGIA